MILYCDNKSAISMAHNVVHHDRTKHKDWSTLYQRDSG